MLKINDNCPKPFNHISFEKTGPAEINAHLIKPYFQLTQNYFSNKFKLNLFKLSLLLPNSTLKLKTSLTKLVSQLSNIVQNIMGNIVQNIMGSFVHLSVIAAHSDRAQRQKTMLFTVKEKAKTHTGREKMKKKSP